MKLTRRQFVGLAGAVGAASCARNDEKVDSKPKPPKPLKDVYTFATIGDIHLVDAKSTAIVNRAVNIINFDPEIEFTVVLGDLGTDGTLVEMNLAKLCLDRLENPYYVIPGNHDVNTTRDDEYANYEMAFGERNWREKKDGWLYIGLDTCNGTAADVTLPQERMDWLAEVVRKTDKDRPIALMTHHPLNPNSAKYRVGNADEILAVFAEHNLRIVASGHYHGNQVERANGVLFTTTACCSSTRENADGTTAKGFRLFRIDKQNNVETEFVPVEY